jgi:hypothetical protein
MSSSLGPPILGAPCLAPPPPEARNAAGLTVMDTEVSGPVYAACTLFLTGNPVENQRAEGCSELSYRFCSRATFRLLGGAFGAAPRNSVPGRTVDRFDRTACLARSLSPPGPTTHSFELGNFPLCAKRPRTGGLCRRWSGLCRDEFRRGGDFGRVVSGLEIRLPGNGDRCRQRRGSNRR